MRQALLLVACAALLRAQNSIEVINNHPFPVRQPVGDVMVDVAANARAILRLSQPAAASELDAAPEAGGLRVRYRGADLGRITWSVIVKPAGRVDHAADFEPLALRFKQAARHPLYTEWRAESQRSGFAIVLTARVWSGGFLDWSMALRNASADQLYQMYGAVEARWEHPAAARRLLSYDNRAEDFDREGKTRFSAGEGRHQALQHGLDWLALDFGSASALVLNGFSQLSTVLDDTQSARNKSPRFTGASLPQFKNEARVSGDSLYLIAEFARENKPYRDRFAESRLPDIGRTIVYDQRIAFGTSLPAREQADQRFVAYNTRITRTTERIEIGVPAVVFGASYFPYSTLGENFGELKLPGQQTDAFWPLSADTVTHWKDFADDIRRDLRIAKSMGYSVIRLHYADVIAKLPEPLQYEYLDFLFSELRHLKLRALFSTAFTYWTPEEIAARVARYKDVIGRVEIENEVLIWGIPLDRPQYWARIFDAVKKVAPNVQVHWTSHLNTGIFDRMEDLKVKCDAVSAHSYIDAIDAIPSGRGFALAVGNYASRKGKQAIYTEWNWRGLTRMAPEARARIYTPIMENLLATRSISELYPFQFQQTMCVNPHTRKGIRQYEPLWLSRRPKPEGFELVRLIEKYSAPDAPDRIVVADHPVAGFANGAGTATFHLANPSGRALRLRLSVEGPAEVTAHLDRAAVDLAPGASVAVPVHASLRAASKPGFYHVFLRVEGDGLPPRYGWAELRNAGQPEGAQFDLNRAITVVYGQTAPNIEMEAGYLVAATVESASGRPVALYASQDLPADDPGTLIVIGTPKTNPLAASPRPGTLVLENFDASVRFVLGYWKHAKDSAARRVGLVKKQLAAGADVANLP